MKKITNEIKTKFTNFIRKYSRQNATYAWAIMYHINTSRQKEKRRNFCLTTQTMDTMQ